MDFISFRVSSSQFSYYFLVKQEKGQMKKDNSFLYKAGRTQVKSPWKTHRKQDSMDLTRKQAGENLVYRVLKQQRDTKTILSFLLGGAEANHGVTLASIRTKTRQSQRNESKMSKRLYTEYQSKQRQNFQKKADNIMMRTKRMTEQLQASKKKVKILDKFNRKVNRYYNQPSTNREYQEEQDLSVANSRLIKLCKESDFPVEPLHQRAHSCSRYEQPRIPFDKLKKLKERHKKSLYNSTKHQSSSLKKLQARQ